MRVIIEEQDRISECIVEYYKELIGKYKNRRGNMECEVMEDGSIVTDDDRLKLCEEVTDVEVKEAMFGIDSEKAPGADGYTSLFSKELDNLNAEMLNDYKPISLCNVVYKCITKIIAKRLSSCLGSLVRNSQSTFVLGRKISDNVLLAHELFIRWIMVCVRTPTFSIMINGKPEGYFPGACGVRQGDPMFPLLFVLVMEYLSRALNKICDESFGYHFGCNEMRIKHLCFADDLFIFCKGNLTSVKQITRVLQHFHGVTRLKMNENKSSIYFSGVEEGSKASILQEMGFSVGFLPIRYLGVPLISKRLTKEDCSELTEKITKRVSHWTVRHLTYAGRLQLVNDVLFSMQVYWSSMFMLTLSVTRNVEKICRTFLWKGSVEYKNGSLVAWDKVCKKKCEGGLRIKNMVLWNRVAIMKHVWVLISLCRLSGSSGISLNCLASRE
ncbi:uncharacterized protein LOC126657045 [Mercurialis annua]|uniref:uncharacterized protein LOC126657045 n=1 Tax=Mercurialis annua TaxID=3986 RepID=UPI0021604C0E|nr:uncharacterized protein LOC126657045 [Mercurialis annua]